MTPHPLVVYSPLAAVSSARSCSRAGEETRRTADIFSRPTLSTCLTWLDEITVDVLGLQADRPLDIPRPSFFTLLDPPEANPQSSSALPPTGVKGVAFYISPHVTVVLAPKLDTLCEQELSVDFRHSGWKHDRRRVYDAFQRTHQPLNRLCDFAACGKHAYVYQSVDNPDVYVIRGSTCHDRFCLPCGRDRSRIIATNVLDKLEHEQGRFLTLTLQSSTEPLADLLAKLTTDFATLRRTKLWKNKVTGGVAFLEVEWKENTQRWHPHLHCLIQGRYLPREALAKTWYRVTGTSYIVDIRLATDNAYVTHYITKYASKPLDHSVLMQPDRLDEMILALKGKRLCMTFGTWRGYKLTEPLENGKWINLGSLCGFVTRATAGSVTDQKILAALSIDLAQSGIPPPAITAPLVSSLTHEQQIIRYPDRTSLLPAAYGTL